MAPKKAEKRGLLSKAFKKLEQRPAEAPKSLKDTVFTLAEAIRFGYSETLGKWHLLDLPRAIVYTIIDKDKKTVATECGERSDCNLLKGPELLKELYELRKLLTLTRLFSKKRFRAFLSTAGFAKEDVLLRKRRARILKPAFTVLRDKESKRLLVFIRGTKSIKDTLTDAIGAPVSFNHLICSDGELKMEKVSGHAHRGMVAAANWIKKHCTPVLLDALLKYPDFKIKIVGHSLGGGTAALLTYKLREIKQFSSSTCVTFGPAASVSLELAEFGKPFITSIINGRDVVPTLSASSVHGFISEGKIKRKKFLVGIASRLPFASTAKAIADHAVTHGTQVIMKHRQRARSLLTWSGPKNTGTLSSSKSDNLAEASQSSETTCESLLTEELIIDSTTDEDKSNSSGEGSDNDDMDEEEQIIHANQNIANTSSDEELLLNQLEKLELEEQEPNIHVQEKEAATTKDITEEESVELDIHALYPPGRIMHIVPLEDSNSNYDDPVEKPVYLYETTTQMYGKLRLTRMMIFDHLTNRYLKMLNRVIDSIMVDDEPKNSK